MRIRHEVGGSTALRVPTMHADTWPAMLAKAVGKAVMQAVEGIPCRPIADRLGMTLAMPT